ncbi:MAG: hypothetical protein AABW50_01750 [Nanoarchaeota archaeon]
MGTGVFAAAGLVFLMVLATFLVFMFTMRRHKNNPDYYALFIIGILWFIIGIPIKNYFLSLIGLIFFAVGIANKDKWKANRRQWHKMSPHERKLVVFEIITLAILILLGVLISVMF